MVTLDDLAAAHTIERLSRECESLANENDRLRELVKDFVKHNDHYPDLYHPGRAWVWVEEGNTLKEQSHE